MAGARCMRGGEDTRDAAQRKRRLRQVAGAHQGGKLILAVALARFSRGDRAGRPDVVANEHAGRGRDRPREPTVPPLVRRLPSGAPEARERAARAAARVFILRLCGFGDCDQRRTQRPLPAAAPSRFAKDRKERPHGDEVAHPAHHRVRQTEREALRVLLRKQARADDPFQAFDAGVVGELNGERVFGNHGTLHEGLVAGLRRCGVAQACVAVRFPGISGDVVVHVVGDRVGSGRRPPRAEGGRELRAGERQVDRTFVIVEVERRSRQTLQHAKAHHVVEVFLLECSQRGGDVPARRCSLAGIGRGERAKCIGRRRPSGALDGSCGDQDGTVVVPHHEDGGERVRDRREVEPVDASHLLAENADRSVDITVVLLGDRTQQGTFGRSAPTLQHGTPQFVACSHRCEMVGIEHLAPSSSPEGQALGDRSAALAGVFGPRGSQSATLASMARSVRPKRSLW